MNVSLAIFFVNLPDPLTKMFIWQSSFRGEDFLEINQSETRIACGAMFVNGSGRFFSLKQIM
jgi:hypothetical protein